MRRLTYLGVNSTVIGWTPDGAKILFASDHAQPFDRIGWVRAVSPEGGATEPFPVGPAVSISMLADGRTVIGRNNNDPARWKRYRGGTAGDLWIDSEGQGQFHRLIQVDGNAARPMWVGERVYFLSDHEGIGNLYSCTPDGADLRRETNLTEYFVRFPNSDGARIVFQSGGDLYLFDPGRAETRMIDIRYHSPRAQRQRRFAEAPKHLEGYDPHPQGHSIALNARGRSFTLGNFEGPVLGHIGDGVPARARLTRWLRDGQRVVLVCDRSGEDALEIHAPGVEPRRLDGLDIGRPIAMKVSPTADQAALINHRHELICVDLVEGRMEVCDRSVHGAIGGMDWSPDGQWIAYGFPISSYQSAIKLWNRKTGDTHVVTRPVLRDTDPAFDTEGRYLYFIGERELNPVYDNLQFELSFPKGARPYLVTLREDLPSPFLPAPHALDHGDRDEVTPVEVTTEEEKEEKKPAAETPEAIRIDLTNITTRVVAFPVPEGLYRQVAGVKERVFFTVFPPEGAITARQPGEPDVAKGLLQVFDLKHLRLTPFVNGVSDFKISRDRKTLTYRTLDRLRVVRVGERPDERSGQEAGRKTGYLDLGRVRILVEPAVEWRQMAHEAWRLQRDYFWTEDMSRIDWGRIWERYSPLIERVGTRGEFSDLVWEMQGELGTSHAYEGGGDYRREPSYPQGFLGADLEYDSDAGAYRVRHVVQGASGEESADSPLRGPGVNIRVGDRIRAINGRALPADRPWQELLLHQAGAEIALTVEGEENRTRTVTVRALRSEFPARYREWVEGNRERVHAASGGRVGYVHIPDMGARGYAEFHRLYLAEVAYDGLIVDVRYNRGGHVSQLLIEKLARKRVGYDISRWGQPDPYPAYSPAGPMVALTNQWAGSDGDIFSHVFKLKKLGTLIGKRTWGGVIGISPRNPLADGSVTTQPEFSFWFEDVGWGVENYGTDPDIDIDIAPQDYANGRDPQMERAIELILEQLRVDPPAKPDFSVRPNLSVPERLRP
jgi:tricorn protease